MTMIRRETQELLTPQEVVDNATTQAKLLMDIVDKTHSYQTISGKKYLQVEAWETIGAFNRVHAVTESIVPIKRDEFTVGYDAKVNLVNQDGIVVGSAIMPCYFTENACKGKEGDAKDKACKSAAQTFATSKAYRMNYSYVAILAGYEPVPAEEVGESHETQPDVDTSAHYCVTHKVNFFKKGKMRGYSHPIEGTNPVEWCNEPSEEKPTPKTEPTPIPATSQASSKPVESPQGSNPSLIDLTWLKESLEKLQWADAGGYLKRKYKLTGTKVSELVQGMTKEQASEFTNEINERLGMLQ